MTILFYGLAIASALYGTLFVTNKKKQLTDELILEFEKTIKPKLIGFILIQTLPLALICFFVLSNTPFKPFLLMIGGITIPVISAIGYFSGRRILNESENSIHFKYLLNLFIFLGLTNLLAFTGVLYSLKNHIFY
ncbi:MAG: hypothetical protein ACO1N0_02310 [Fluviicola sp.]